jgi:eukaryotic-like serine/threonine-protein kinase
MPEQPDNPVPPPPAADLRSTIKIEPPDEFPGRMIGRYKLLETIGEGGCGVVYVAEQTEPVRRRVALKLIKLGMDTRAVVARFEAERQALALMDHPNIAQVFDAGTTNTGRPFFVMELVRGIKITDHCDRHKLSTQERLNLFIQVCHAVQHAHQKGIIHRDLKPSNVLVTLHDGVPVPKVIDFGIAKAINNQPLTDKTIYTAFEQFIGTPAYMSPEQAEMSGLDIDTRTDIYSLGVLLYELLTGSTPFDPNTLLQASLDRMRHIICDQEPPRPSNRLSTLDAAALTTVARDRRADPPRLLQIMRGDLDWISMKCLEKDRARRYETANALAVDIQHYLENEPVAARPPSPTYRLQKLVRRNKLVFAAAGAVATTLAVGIVVSTWQAVRARRTERFAEGQRQKAEMEARRADLNAENEKLQRQVAEQNARKSREVLDFIQTMLMSAGGSYADKITGAQVLDRSVVDAERRFTEPDARASVRYAIGYCYSKLGKWEQAAKLLESSFSERERIFGFAHPDTLDAARETASVAFSRGKAAEAMKLTARVAEAAREAARQPKFAAERQRLRLLELWAFHKLAQGYMEEGKLAEARPLIEEMLKAAKANEFTTPADSGGAYSEAGALALAEGHPREALQYLDAGLRCYGEGYVLQRAWLEGLRGAAWLALEDYIQAEPLITNSLPTLQKRFGDSHFRVQRAYRDLVRLYGAMNQPAKADEWKKRLAP